MAQQENQVEEQYLTASEAARELGTTRAKMADLLKKGVLPYTTHPLDRRLKLIPRSAVEQLGRVRLGRVADGPKGRRTVMGASYQGVRPAVA